MSTNNLSPAEIRKTDAIKKVLKGGRRIPYTEQGIKRVPCFRCGKKPSVHQFQVCADGRIFRPLCSDCDVALNRLVLEWFGDPDTIAKMEHYSPTLATLPKERGL